MRKTPVSALAAVASFVLAGCGGLAQEPTPAPEDVLFLRSSGGVTLVRTLPEAAAVRFPHAVPSTDWSAVVRAARRGDDTQVVVLDTSSGVPLWSRTVPGKLEVKVASEGGRLVALGPPRQTTGYPSGRSSTTFVLTIEDSTAPRTITLEGNFEPEAFSTDGDSLFVVEYLPPRAPTSYRVRRLDLATEEVMGVYTVDAELQEAMQGTARIQVASPDGRRLYTLYSLEDGHGGSHAFIHVLSLDEEWAHCVDLPAAFGTGPEKAIALSVSPDGSRLYAADGSSNVVAEVDTENLTVSRTTQVMFGSRGAPAHAVRGHDGMLYLASGTRLLAVGTSTLAGGRSWDMESKITGIQSGNDGRRLYVGLRDQIVVLDTETGRRTETLSPDHLGTIEQLGETSRPLSVDRTEITCAC
jgi:hypothetical protein